MKALFCFVLLISTASAQVMDLGTIDNTKGLLDQRHTLEVTEHERLRSLGNFYESKKNDFEKNLLAPSGAKSESGIDINQQWSELIGGT